jgi:hypothetical protein
MSDLLIVVHAHCQCQKRGGSWLLVALVVALILIFC